MATLEQLRLALRNADAAGDTQAAKQLAASIQRMQSGSGSIGVKNPQAVEPASGFEGGRLSQIAQGIANSPQAQDLMHPGKGVQALTDMGRIATDTASFGGADWLSGHTPSWLGGGGTVEEERAKTKAARERAGWAGTGLDVTTALETAPTLPARMLEWASPLVRGSIRALEGGGQAGVSAVGHGETDPAQIAKQALLGIGLSAGGQIVGGKAAAALDRRRAGRDLDIWNPPVAQDYTPSLGQKAAQGAVNLMDHPSLQALPAAAALGSVFSGHPILGPLAVTAATAAGSGVKKGLASYAGRVPPAGTDPAAVDAARDYIARLMSASTRAGEQRP